MTDSTLHGAIGSDGHIPIYDPMGAWRIWALHETYQGTVGQNMYVPKILDYVIEVRTFTTYIVESLDPVTLIPVLREIRPANMSLVLSQADVLFGVGPGTQSQQMRVYLNKSTVPYSLQVDQLLRIGGTMTSYAKIFRGSVIGNTGEVISRMYDAAGNFVSENVPLEMLQLDNHTNYCEKVVAQCKCTVAMPDNELLTIVFYSASGVPVSKAQLLVENTDYVKPLNVGTRYIKYISLITPFMSEGNNNQIDFPLNLPKTSANFEGVVHYSDGSMSQPLPVNGTKFSLLGFDQLLSTVVGQKIDLVLRYVLSADEASFAPNTVQGKAITQAYTLQVVNPNYSYAVKLFPFPVWDDLNNGYSLRWWLLSLDRTFFQDVTAYVNFDARMGAWDPYKFGSRQRKQVSINLRNVSAAFKPFVHTQIVEVALYDRPEIAETPWTVCNEAMVNHPDYGFGLFAKAIGVSAVNLSSDILSIQDWTERVYDRGYPLVNPSIELAPPRASHFAVRYKGMRVEREISFWDKDIDLGIGVDPKSNVVVEFFKRTASGDIILSVSEFIIKE